MSNEMRKLIESVTLFEVEKTEFGLHRAPSEARLSLFFTHREDDIYNLIEFNKLEIEAGNLSNGEYIRTYLPVGTFEKHWPQEWINYDILAYFFFDILQVLHDVVDGKYLIDYSVAGYALLCEDLHQVKLYPGPPGFISPDRITELIREAYV